MVGDIERKRLIELIFRVSRDLSIRGSLVTVATSNVESSRTWLQ